MLNQLARELYYFQMDLPNTPLKTLNCYIIRPEDGGRCLLVDTGFRHPQCWAALQEGMDEAGLLPENTDVFLTHAHSDHSGNAAALQALGCRILISDVDCRLYNSWQRDKAKEDYVPRQVLEGMPEEMFLQLFRSGATVQFNAPPFQAVEVTDGQTLQYGRFHLQCIMTPGHTPGHMCLYEAEKEILFLGDHVLFDITPNICDFKDMPDSLGCYLESLRKIRRLPVSLALPAHRGFGSVSLTERIDQILAHHERRLAETIAAVRELGPLTAYEVAQHLSWKIRAKSWEEFPTSQKWFALGETLAHLDYLCNIGALTRSESKGIIQYLAVTSDSVTV